MADAEAFLAAHEGLEEALSIRHNISSDLAAKLCKYGALSDAQVALAFKLHTQVSERAAREAAAEPVPMTDDRITITGRVISTKVQDSMYGSTIKMLLVDDRGFKLYGTAPSKVLDTCYGEDGRWERSFEDVVKGGLRVSFSAKVERSRDDAKFGFYSRPTKVKVL